MYPLKFASNLHEKIWGGQKLEKIFSKKAEELKNIGESWELSAHSSNPSVVINGEWKGQNLIELVEQHKEQLVGKKVYEKYQNDFPLLFKFIDANDDLSIQVHPNDEQSQKRHNSFGKTEMWYVLDAEPNAFLIVGFDKKCSKEKYLEALEKGEVEQLLRKVPVKKGDVFFIHAGLVHAIGKGVLIAEIQESSDITYRIFDYNRKDDNGNERELHTQQAIDVIDFTTSEKAKIQYEPKANESVNIVTCDHFKTNLLIINQPKEIHNPKAESFIVYMCLNGNVEVESNDTKVVVNAGETVMLPASVQLFTITPTKEVTLLEVTIP